MKAFKICSVVSILLASLLFTSCGMYFTQKAEPKSNSEAETGTESNTVQYIHEPVFYTDSIVSVDDGVASFNGKVCSFSWDPNEWSYAIGENEFTLTNRLENARIIKIKVLDQRDGVVDSLVNYCRYEVEKHFDVPFDSQFIAYVNNNGDDYLGIINGFLYTFEDEPSIYSTALSRVYAYTNETGSAVIAVTLYGGKDDIEGLSDEYEKAKIYSEGILEFTGGVLDTLVLK